MHDLLRRRWRGPGGYREVLSVAVPLVLSTGSTSILHFVDNVLLSWYSTDALSAAMPGALMSLTFFAFFVGTIGFVNTFVAQYDGSGQHERIGVAVWQGIWLASLGAVFFLVLIPFIAEPLFRMIGHAPAVRELEVDYFRILGMASGLPIYTSALAAFYSGRGKSWPLMWVNLGQVCLNIFLDYVLIFGKFGLPVLGIRGAAIATVISLFFGSSMLTFLFLMPANNRRYGTRASWRPDFNILRRLLHYGIPNGLHFFLDMAAFNMFVLLVGRLGTVELAATNMTLRVNLLLFLPMIGFGIATSSLVGRYLGANSAALSQRAAWSSFQLTVAYMLIFALMYVFFPRWFLLPFALHADPEGFDAIMDMGILLMRFIAVYSVFDTMQVVFSSALRGAGDTRFVMRYSVIVLWLFLVLPVLLVTRYGGSVYHAWGIFACAIAILGTGMLLRFLAGKWKEIRVIEVPDSEIGGSTVAAAEQGEIFADIIPD